jgi:hypothetical protein
MMTENQTETLEDICSRFPVVIVESSALDCSFAEKKEYDKLPQAEAWEKKLGVEANSLELFRRAADSGAGICLMEEDIKWIYERFNGMSYKEMIKSRAKHRTKARWLAQQDRSLKDKNSFYKAAEKYVRERELLCRIVKRRGAVIGCPEEAQVPLYNYYRALYCKEMTKNSLKEYGHRLLAMAAVLAKFKGATAILTRNCPLLYSWSEIMRGERGINHMKEEEYRAYRRTGRDEFIKWDVHNPS